MDCCNIYFLNSFKVQLNISVFRFVVKLADDFQNIVVNEITLTSVNCQYTVFRNII